MIEDGTLESVISRLEHAHKVLGELAGEEFSLDRDEHHRLKAKQEGVSLALSYAYEELRLKNGRA